MDELRQNEIDSDRTGRSLPLQVSYHGFPVYVRLEYINLADGKERRIAKVVISYREQFKESKKRRKKQYGKAVLERKYSPVGEGTREEVINNKDLSASEQEGCYYDTENAEFREDCEQCRLDSDLCDGEQNGKDSPQRSESKLRAVLRKKGIATQADRKICKKSYSKRQNYATL